jgi:hypothetical protein
MNCSNDSSNRGFPAPPKSNNFEKETRQIIIIITLCFTWLILDDSSATAARAKKLAIFSNHRNSVLGERITESAAYASVQLAQNI